MIRDLFAEEAFNAGKTEHYFSDVTVLRAFATDSSEVVMKCIKTHIVPISPFRHMTTRRGHSMSAALTNCGSLGWISDTHGYRYDPIDPITSQPWPVIPEPLLELSKTAAKVVGYKDFEPDSCIINCYKPSTKMGLHQDNDERDLNAPIVSFSFGIPATFLLGGLNRQEKTIKIPLFHGDVIIWGGADRLRFHGIAPVKSAHHNDVGDMRINLTFRKAG